MRNTRSAENSQSADGYKTIPRLLVACVVLVVGIAVGAIVFGVTHYSGLWDHEYARRAPHGERSKLAAIVGAIDGGLVAMISLGVWGVVALVRRDRRAYARKRLALEIFEARQEVARGECTTATPDALMEKIMKDLHNE